MQHYVVQMGTSNKPKSVGMLDMNKYIRTMFDADMLEHRVIKNVGGNSKVLLGSILLPGSATSIFHAKQLADADFVKVFQQYGPALISTFNVYPSFKTHQGPFLGATTASEKPDGTHAMVIVGHRWESQSNAKGTLRLLVQNWWETKQFVEMDLAYLAACNAFVTFVETKQKLVRVSSIV